MQPFLIFVCILTFKKGHEGHISYTSTSAYILNRVVEGVADLSVSSSVGGWNAMRISFSVAVCFDASVCGKRRSGNQCRKPKKVEKVTAV